MKPRYRFTHETVQRALDVHKAAGRIMAWRLTDAGRDEIKWHGQSKRPRYVVDLYDFGHFVGTIGETHALVVGLRVGELHEQHTKADTR